MKKFLIIISLIGTLIPVFFVIDKAGGLEEWQGVLPRGTTDSVYYYARMQEVLDGYPQIGNPYVYEYRNEKSPAFFLPDIVSAIPALIGVPFNIGLIINFFVWGFLLLFVTYKLLRELHISSKWSLLFSVILYASSYSFILRPTVMQIVFPLAILFLLVYLRFLYHPNSKKRGLQLAVVSALTFYVYNFLYLIVFITLGLTFIWYLISKQWDNLKSLFINGIYTTVLLVPFIFYSLSQMKGEFYQETVIRLGWVNTHIPAVEAIFFGRWIAIGILAFGILMFVLKKHRTDDDKKNIFWFVTGGALMTGLFLNVISGFDITFAIHVARFVVLWMVVLLGVLTYEWYLRKDIKSNWVEKLSHVVVVVLILFMTIGVVRNVPRAMGFFDFDEKGIKLTEIQTYAGPLNWLEENVKEEAVIWANTSISAYVPLLTHHYPLFYQGAVLHAIGAAELEGRYLLSKSLQDVTVETLKDDFALYAGAGKWKETPRVINQEVWVCNAKNKYLGKSKECRERVTGISLQGEEYFENLLTRFEKIKENRDEALDSFNVSYLIVDKERDSFSELNFSNAVYTDERFVILPIPL